MYTEWHEEIQQEILALPAAPTHCMNTEWYAYEMDQLRIEMGKFLHEKWHETLVCFDFTTVREPHGAWALSSLAQNHLSLVAGQSADEQHARIRHLLVAMRKAVKEQHKILAFRRQARV